jgi:hypothetical protein
MTRLRGTGQYRTAEARIESRVYGLDGDVAVQTRVVYTYTTRNQRGERTDGDREINPISCRLAELDDFVEMWDVLFEYITAVQHNRPWSITWHVVIDAVYDAQVRAALAVLRIIAFELRVVLEIEPVQMPDRAMPVEI